MSLSKTILFDEADNFSFDSDKIEIVSGAARLKLVNSTASFNQPFASGAGFTLDAAKSEVTAGVLRQKDKRGTGNMYANFASSINANWARGSGTATAFNGAAVSAGKLDLSGATDKYITLVGTSNSTGSQAGAVRFRVTPLYSGNPATPQVFYTETKAFGDNSNSIVIFHYIEGSMYVRMASSTGTIVIECNLGTWVPVSGTEYEFELNFNIDTGVFHLFIDGDAFGEGDVTQDVDWTNLINATDDGSGKITGTGAGDGWNRGGESVQTVAAGSFSLKWNQFYNKGFLVAGIITGAPLTQDYGNVPLPSSIYKYAFLPYQEGDGLVKILDPSGSGYSDSIFDTTYQDGDSFEIRVDGDTGVVTFYIADVLVFTSAVLFTFYTARVAATFYRAYELTGELTSPGGGLTNTGSGTGTRDSVVGVIAVGKYHDGITGSADFKLDDLTTFSTVQHSSAYSAPSTNSEATVYLGDLVTLPIFNNAEPFTLTDFTTVQSSTPHYILNSKYWNGSAWVVSDGTYTQSNTATEVDTNIAALAATSLTVKVVTQAGNTQMSVSDLTVDIATSLYATDNPTITPNTGDLMDALLSLSAVTTATGSDAVRCVIEKIGVGLIYFDTEDSWPASDGTYAQSNSIAEAIAGLSFLDISTGVTLRLKIFLHSDDGSTTPSITSLTEVYNYFLPDTTVINKCTVYVRLRDILGDRVTTGATFYAQLKKPFYIGDNLIEAQTKSVVLDSKGEGELTLVESASSAVVAKYYFTLTYVEGLVTKTVTFKAAVVPNQASIALSALARVGKIT